MFYYVIPLTAIENDNSTTYMQGRIIILQHSIVHISVYILFIIFLGQNKQYEPFV